MAAEADIDTWKAFEKNPVSHSVAHHVVAIANLRQRQGYARVSDVAKELNITRGSASLTLKSLKQKGLVLEDDNRFLLLSKKGQFIADSVRGKKYIMKKLLSQLLGVPAEQADIDTCKIEHLLSDCTAQRSALFLRFLESDDPRITAFVDAWREYNLPCTRDPAECPSCELDCMDVMYKEKE